MEYFVADLYEENKRYSIKHIIIFTRNLEWNISNVLLNKDNTAWEYWNQRDMINLSLKSFEANILYLKEHQAFEDDTLEIWSDSLKHFKGMWEGIFHLIHKEFGNQFRLEDEEFVRREMEYDAWLKD